jgi:hypothetical protein
MREHSRDKSRARQFDRNEDGTVLSVVVMNRTNVDLTLRWPLVVPFPRGAETITELRLYVDDARGLANQVRGRPQRREGLTGEPVIRPRRPTSTRWP